MPNVQYSGYVADNAKRAKEEQVREQRQDAYEKSPQAKVDQVCGLYNQVNYSQKAIDQEKESAERFGVFNKVKMYEYGQILRMYEAQLAGAKITYKKEFGKPFSPGICMSTKSIASQ